MEASIIQIYDFYVYVQVMLRLYIWSGQSTFSITFQNLKRAR